MLFHKGRELYGLYETRRARSTLKRLLVVEGYMDAVRLHQSGITYAVATLGTATTPEHLKRIFRLVSEVVFCVRRRSRRAGGRLARAAARAAGGARGAGDPLPVPARGHDPDTLVGGGRAGGVREAPGGTTVPLSEYLIRELSEQADLTMPTAARASPKPRGRCLRKSLPGVFRELLLARLARVIGLAPERLQELWSGGGTTPRPPAGPLPRRHPLASSPAGRAPARGRGSLVRQAIVRLLWFPPSPGR